MENSGKKFLKDYERIKTKLQKAYEQKENLEAKATSTNIMYNRIGGTNHGHNDKTGHSAILLVDIQEKIEKLTNEYKLYTSLLRNYLKQMEYFDGVIIIKQRHIYNASWYEIEDTMKMSERSVFRKYAIGIEELSRLIDQVEHRERKNLEKKTIKQ